MRDVTQIEEVDGQLAVILPAHWLARSKWQVGDELQWTADAVGIHLVKSNEESVAGDSVSL